MDAAPFFFMLRLKGGALLLLYRFLPEMQAGVFLFASAPALGYNDGRQKQQTE
jgi:hypothetical protein